MRLRGLDPNIPATWLKFLSFDLTDLVDGPSDDGIKRWWTPQDDGVLLYYFDLPPDLPGELACEEDLGDYYRSLIEPSRHVETSMLMLDGCAVVRNIVKLPQESSGMTYVGTLTIPFRDFSFVVKAMCMERGVTGMREATLFAKHGELKDGESADAEERMDLPVDADSARFDAQFPDHPASRVRARLTRIQDSLVMSDALKRCPPFPLPGVRVESRAGQATWFRRLLGTFSGR